MDTITIIGILIGLAFGIFFLVVEKAFDKMFNQIFKLIGLKSSTGPIRIHVSHKNHIIELKICNQGKGKAMLVAIEGMDRSGQKVFPVPFTSAAEAEDGIPEKRMKELRKHFASENIPSGGTKSAYLYAEELAGGDLSEIRVLDRDGTYWSVTIN